MFKPAFLAAAFSVASLALAAPARAEESSVWNEAFPRSGSSRVGRVISAAGQGAAALVEVNAGLAAAVAYKESGRDLNAHSAPAAAAPADGSQNVAAQKLAFEELLEKHTRLQKFALAENLGVLSPADAEELRALRAYVQNSPYTLDAARQLEEEHQILMRAEQRSLAARPTAPVTESLPPRRLKGAVAYRGLSAATLAALVADAGLRVLGLIQGRDPGYVPAVNLSRAAIKHAVSPAAAAAAPTETTLSAQ